MTSPGAGAGEQQSFNDGANFWHYDIGVPTIPGTFKTKEPAVKWREYQENPPTEDQHKAWLESGAYSGGIMILCGPVHRKDREGLYLVGLDFDKQKAIDEFCTRNGKKASFHDDIAKKMLVELHEDRPDKAHCFFYSPFLFPVKRPDSKIGIEIKSSPKHGLMRVTPSVTEAGYPLKIIGTMEPAILNELQATELLQHLNHICINNGVEYLEKKDGSGSSYVTPELKQIIKSLSFSFDDKKDQVKIVSGYRNQTLISVANHILFAHLRRDRSNEEKLKQFFLAINHFCCDGPLPNSEVEAIWASAIKWAYPQIINPEFKAKTSSEEERQKKKEEQQDDLEDLLKDLDGKYHFKTLKDTGEIWHYNEDRGVYDNNGEVIIKSALESKFDLVLTNKDVSEFLGHIQRRTFFDRSGFNPDIEWLGCADRMLNLRTGETKPFSPDFLNTACIPVKYSDAYATGPAADFFRLVERRYISDYSNCQCPKIMRFLDDIVEPDDVELLLDFIAYCLWRDYKYANWLLLTGYGQNGKSVLLNMIEIFLGKSNTSAESLERLLNKQFARASLFQKMANIDADVSSDILITNTGELKKLTGNDESPGEFKYKPPFKFRNFAKLIFSCNEIPEIKDMTDAFFRRLIIINFTRQFFAEKDDPFILEKICTEEEFSGLLHELLRRLPRIIKQGIRPTTNETMQETYEKYVRGSNPIQYFVDKALTVIDAAENVISKDEMYDSYCLFCRANKIATESERSFSKKLTDIGFQIERVRRNKKRDYYWINVKIRDWKAIEDSDQQTLTELTGEQLEKLKWD